MKNVRTRALLALMGSAGIPLACTGGGAVNIGNTDVIGSQLSDYAATWDGYAEAYAFTPDNSDHVRLTIGANGQGTLEVGNQPLVAPPTDPNLGFPAGVVEDPKYGRPAPPIWEGGLYPIYSAQVQTNRIQVGIKPNDYYAAWCALQTPTSTSYREEILADGGPPNVVVHTKVTVDAGPDLAADAGVTTVYSACPFTGGSSTFPAGAAAPTCSGQEADGHDVPVDCGKFYLCTMMVCGCTATSCTSSPLLATGSAPSQYPVELDAALDSTGRTLTGTLALAPDLRVTVVLTKQ